MKIKVLQNINQGTTFTRFLEFNGKKFKFKYDNRNGVPLGFDNRFTASVFKNDTWTVIAGKKDVGFTCISYVENRDARETDSEKFFNLLNEHIAMLYS